MTPERRAFYQYHSALVEPWDGPAAITYTDGRFVGTILDRNGLRPARYVVLDNGYVISSSEVGAVAYDEARVVKKGSLGPGQIFCVDTGRGVIMEDEEITQYFASRQPYDRWVQQNLVSTLDALVRDRDENDDAAAVSRHMAAVPLTARQASFGYTSEEMVVVLRPMVTEGKEPVGAMGDDTPAAALSKLPRPLFHYFKQRFAEVTNPPIDPLREEMVMSTRMLLGGRANLLSEIPEATRLIELQSPLLLPEQMAALMALRQPESRTSVVDATWSMPYGVRRCRMALQRLTGEAAGAALACRLSTGSVGGRGCGAQRRHPAGHQRCTGRPGIRCRFRRCWRSALCITI